MAYVHNIFITNSFKDGRRIGYDLVLPQENIKNDTVKEVDKKVTDFISEIFNEAGKDAVVTAHSIITESTKWKSVVKKDSFFKDIKIVEDKNAFIQYVKCNNHLTKSDIMALIILFKQQNNILDNTDDETILESIKKTYKQEFNEEIFSEPVTDDNEMVFPENIKDYVNIITDRILSAKDGFAKLRFIINELNNFYSEDSNKR